VSGGPQGIVELKIKGAQAAIGAPLFDCDCDILLDSLFFPVGPSVGFVPFNVRIRACGEAEATARIRPAAAMESTSDVTTDAGKHGNDAYSVDNDTIVEQTSPLILTQMTSDTIQSSREWRLSQESIVDEHYSATMPLQRAPAEAPTSLITCTGQVGNDGFAIDLESI